MRFPSTLTLRRHLLLLILAVLLPLFAFSSFLVLRYAQAEQQAGQERLIRASQGLADSLDREVEASMQILNALALSRDLDDHNFHEFYEELTRVLVSHPSWVNIILHDTPTSAIVVANRPWGTKFETVDPESVAETFRTERVVVANLISRETPQVSYHGAAFAIRVPVFRGSHVKYVLSAVVPATTLQSIVRRTAGGPDGWISAIADSSGRIAARSEEPEKYVGKMGPPTILELNRRGESFLRRVISVSGREIYVAGTHSPITGWSVGVSVPVETLAAPERKALTSLVAIGLSLLICFVGLSLFYSRYLERKIRSAALGAEALARGEAPVIETSNVREFEQLRDSMMRTSSLLRAHEDERAKRLNELTAARADAERADQAKGEFLANMSHELRTPLGVVLGLTDLLANDRIPTDERERNLEAIHRNGAHLLRLIDDILDFTKADAGKIQFESVDFPLRDLITNLVTELRHFALAKGVELKLNLSPNVPDLVNSDPVRIRQILINVIGNALKFTQEGEVAVKVSANGYSLEAQVTDTGIGINDDQRARLFGVFNQADSAHTRKFGGAGLGLALARRLAQGLGGNVILLESKTNAGSKFQINFEVKEPVRALKAADENRTKSIGGSIAGRKILLVEDSSDNVMLILHFLKAVSMKVEVARNGREALERASQASFDIILMDIQMPEMDGYQAVRELRRMGCQIPVVALTAHALKEHRERATAAGFTDFLTKPVSRAALISALKSNLKNPSRLIRDQSPEL